MNSTFLLQKGFLASVLFLLSVLFSCKKDGGLSPDFDNGNLSIIYTDTFSLKTTVLEDPAGRTDIAVGHLLGVYNDPVFGVKSSSIYTNVGISGATDFTLGFNIDTLVFSPNFIVDSLVLSLKIANYYGNSASSFTVNAFELTDPLSSSESYFSNTYSPVQNILLGSTLLTPSTSDSILRIVITEPTLISNIQNTTSYADNSALNAVFKGLYLVSSDTAGATTTIPQGTGAFALFNFNSSSSKITVHYRNGTNPSLKEESLVLNSNVRTYSRFINNYSSTDIEKHLNSDASKNNNRIYVSAMKGVRTKIELPSIKELAKEGKIAINKAEITFTIESGTDESLDEVLSTLALTGINAEGNAIVLLDDPTKEGLEHYGGIYNASTKSISFNITKHIHQLINSESVDYGMYLLAREAVTSANRAVFNSENSPNSKIKLEITYSKL